MKLFDVLKGVVAGGTGTVMLFMLNLALGGADDQPRPLYGVQRPVLIEEPDVVTDSVDQPLPVEMPESNLRPIYGPPPVEPTFKGDDFEE
jgi:hypothetical protein